MNRLLLFAFILTTASCKTDDKKNNGLINLEKDTAINTKPESITDTAIPTFIQKSVSYSKVVKKQTTDIVRPLLDTAFIADTFNNTAISEIEPINQHKEGITNPIEIKDRIAYPKTNPEILFKEIRPEEQKFEVNNSFDTVLRGNDGTIIFVPKNSFISAKGEAIFGKVDISLIEVLTVADFIKSNLQTISNGQVLQSDGMFYINAQYNEQPASLAEGKELKIELPIIHNERENSDLRIFSGEYNKDGNINWNEKGALEKKMIPFPLELFRYHCLKSVDEKHIHIIKKESIGILDSSQESIDNYTYDSIKLKQPNLINTFIATREFEERFNQFESVSWIFRQNIYVPRRRKKTLLIDSSFYNIYLNNLDKPLWYSDSIFCNYLESQAFKEKYKNNYRYNLALEYNLPYLIKEFKKFYDQRLTYVIQFPNIDLSGNNARDSLKIMGYNNVEIDYLIGASAIQRKIITQIIINQSERDGLNSILSNSFSVAKLGWINCDHYYNDPSAEPVNLTASVKNITNYGVVSLALIINKDKIGINGIINDSLEYTFTGITEPYTKLPIGAKATIVAMSYKDNKPYIGMKDIIISKKGDYNIELAESSINDINVKLAGIY